MQGNVKKEAKEFGVKPVSNAMLKGVSYNDVQHLYNFIQFYIKELESPEMLGDAIESLRLAIETRDLELLNKARKQIVMFAVADDGFQNIMRNIAEGNNLDGICNSDEHIALLFT